MMTNYPKRAAAMPLFLVACLLLGLCVSAAPPPAKRRGRLLRVDVRRTEETPSFRWRLMAGTDSLPRLFFEEVVVRVTHKVNIYQTVIEVPASAETNPAGVEYRVVPGELIEGETFAEQQSQVVGPIAGETFLVNEVPMRTDEVGVAVDGDQTLLRLFDDLTVTEVSVRASHPKYGSMLMDISRQVMKRYPQDTPPANLGHTDLLASMGLDFLPRRSSGRDGVTMTVQMPERVRAGESLDVVLTVANGGGTATSSLMGRSFSRHDWLTGRLFYVGSVPPGESVTFTRRFQVPATAKGNLAYGALGFWDLHGAIPNKGLVLQTTIEAIPQPEPKPEPQPEP